MQNEHQNSSDRTANGTGVLESWMHYLRAEKGLSPLTVAAYRRDVGYLLAYLDTQKTPLPSVTHNVLTEFLWEHRSAGKGAVTLARYIQAIRQFFRFLLQEGLCQKDPTLGLAPIKLPERLPNRSLW